MSWRRVLSLLAILVIVLATTASTAAQGGGPAGQVPLNEDDPLVQSANQYAADLDVSLQEAVRRLQLQDVIGALDAELAGREAAIFGGMWIQHTPEYRAIVHLTEGGKERIQSYAQAAGLADVVEVRPVKMSLKALETVQAEAHKAAQAANVAMDSEIDVIENRVNLFVTDRAQLDAVLQAADDVLAKTSDVRLLDNVQVIVLDQLSTSYAYVYGGLAISGCTSGFAVQSGSTKGIITAAHCSNTQQYNSRSLPFQSESFGGSYDVQWHTAPAFFVTNRVYDGINDSTTPYYRYITATKSRANQTINEYVCKYGVTTYYTCGYITSKTYQPSSVPNATATFIHVENPPNRIAYYGDSGGPWFSGSTAYGVLHGGNPSVGDAIYMAIDYISTLGVSVLTTTPSITLDTWRYKNLGDNISYYTGISALDYMCTLSGMAARDGDINENDAGNIIQTYLYKVNNHWWIRGDFRTHNDHESWDFDLMCMKTSVYPTVRYEYRNLGDNISYNTGISTTTYECGVAGMAALDGDIQEHDDGDIIQSYMYKSGGTWWIRADFRTHNNHESWNIDVMCINKSSLPLRNEYRNLGDNISYNTNVSTTTYECAIAGMAARDGDIQEHDDGDIIQTYLYENSGKWWIRADFRTHNDSESWDIDLLCARR